jgi:Protein of unknown function (DUF3429)
LGKRRGIAACGDNPRIVFRELCLSASLSAPSLAATDPVAFRLGYLALLPFVIGAALVWIVREQAHPYVTSALSAYAAVVLAFIGGIHWGFGFAQAHAQPRLFVWGVVPALVAWVAVVMQPYAGLVVHGVMLVVCYLVDRKVYPALGAARWLTLRFRLSMVASLSCFIGAAGS